MTLQPPDPMYRALLILFAVGLAGAPNALAQPALDLDRLDRYFGEEPTVEVNLQGSLLRLAAAATREDEPDAAALMDGLNAVTVRIYPLSSALDELGDDLSDLGQQLEADGWQTFVRVRDHDRENEHREDVWIYVREAGDAFGGLIVMALDEEKDEAAFVVIDGLIEPDQIGRLSSSFGDLDFDWDDEEDGDEGDDGTDEDN